MTNIIPWIILIASIIGAFTVLYFIFAIPLIFYKRKEIAAFDKLAKEFTFDTSLGKAGLKANFPMIKGYYNKRLFVVNKALNKTKSYSTNPTTGITSSRRTWFLKIGTKLTNSKLQKIDIQCKKVFKSKNFNDEFDNYFEIKIIPSSCSQKILTDEIKKDLIEIRKLGGIFYVKLEKNILYTNNFKGLITDTDVETCSRKIKLLSKIADACN